jgi:hypothetical protein
VQGVNSLTPGIVPQQVLDVSGSTQGPGYVAGHVQGAQVLGAGGGVRVCPRVRTCQVPLRCLPASWPRALSFAGYALITDGTRRAATDVERTRVPFSNYRCW